MQSGPQREAAFRIHRLRPFFVTGLALLGAPALLAAQHIPVAQMSPQAAATWNEYISDVEAQNQGEFHNGPFIFIDDMPPKEHRAALARLKAGKVEIRQMGAAQNGRMIQSPQAMINDWCGVIFIPGVTLPQVLAVVQDYGDYQKMYAPGMRRSRMISHKGDDFETSLQFSRRSIVTVILDADFDVEYQQISPNQEVSRSRALRIAEVADPGSPNEHELPPSESHGYLWRLNDYWRFQQRDGGVYVQLESIALSRSLPPLIAWMADPLLKTIPRGVLSSLLTSTRNAVEQARSLTPVDKPTFP